MSTFHEAEAPAQRPVRSCEPFSRRPDRAHGYLPRTELAAKHQVIRHIAGDIATTAADAELLFDALGLDPRDGKIEC